jgi:hypothetical protein
MSRKFGKELKEIEIERCYCDICNKHIRSYDRSDASKFDSENEGYFEVNTCINNITKYYRIYDICFTCAEKLENDLSQIIGKYKIIKK